MILDGQTHGFEKVAETYIAELREKHSGEMLVLFNRLEACRDLLAMMADDAQPKEFYRSSEVENNQEDIQKAHRLFVLELKDFSWGD